MDLTDATLGGPGWRARLADHVSDVSGGALWARCGYRSEVSRLEAVVLARPPSDLSGIEDPRAALMREVVDPGRLRDEVEAAAARLRAAAVEVIVLDPPPGSSPNSVFMRDVMWATPQGIVIGRMASMQRGG